jgi:hypothetical protein
MWQAGATRALREPKRNRRARPSNTRLPLRWPISSRRRPLGIPEVHRDHPSYWRADTKFGVKGPPHAIRVTGDEMPDRVSADPVRQEHHA